MAESFRERLRREARAMSAALDRVLAGSLDDAALRRELEALALEPRFADFTWRWGPVVARRPRPMFRPFILSRFSSLALDASGKPFDPWKGPHARQLEAWLEAADRADDVDVTRRLYGWRLQGEPWRKRASTWRADLVRRFAAATAPSARHAALAKIDVGLALDAATAIALYATDRAAARRFVLDHLPWFGWLGDQRADWEPLLERSKEDPDFHFELYRRVVDPRRWRADVLALGKTVRDAGELDAELERRHPRAHLPEAAEVFLALGELRGEDVMPYLLRHVASVTPRWRLGAREAKGLPGLLALANQRGWLPLWAALLRTSATRALFDGEVRALVRATARPGAEVRTRLALIAGHGAEANFPGLSLAQVQPLETQTALELYERFPDLVRGPFRLHVAPGWHTAYPALVRAAIAARDDDLTDFFASRAAMQPVGEARGWKETLEALTAHYEALDEPTFVARASNALGRMPAFAIWSYDRLLADNRLARLLFERSTGLYLASSRAVRDLLESPQIHVQALAFRILGRDDPRARAIAAEHADLLQATLLRPLHRRTRLLAFAALEQAARHDEATARYLLGRMKEALALPEKRYPAERLVGLIARVLHAWPALRAPAEVPRVFGP